MRMTIPSLVALAALSAGCAERAVEPGSHPSEPATLTIRLVDAPGDVQAAVVTIAEVYLQGTGGRTVLRSTPYTVDLVPLATTSTVLLEDVSVAAGTYSELRFVITGAYVAVEQADGSTRIFATAPDYAGLPAGTVANGDLQLPSFATSGLKVQLSDGGLAVPASGAVSLVVDFDVAQSFGHQAGNSGKWVMHPVITATGATLGTMLTVTLALGSGVALPAGVSLGDFRATLAAGSTPDQVLASTAFSSDAGGTYRAALGFVAPGAYLVDLDVPGTVGGVTVSPSVPVAYIAAAGPATTLALTLTGVTAGGFTLAEVTAGIYHSCGLTPAGATYCWGQNQAGQLGDGTTSAESRPHAVTMPAGVTFASIAGGGTQTCALTPAGAAYCWGVNGSGEVGDGTLERRYTPVAVTGNLTFARIATGYQHTCGLTLAGAAYCWGVNGFGSLGDGTGAYKTSPAAVSGAYTFTRIATGEFHTCALTAAGAAYCWGLDRNGQLGDGGTTNQLSPVAVSAGPAFVRIAAGSDHTCGLTSAGAAYCWGFNGDGQLGDGTTENRLAPTAAVMPSGVTFTEIIAGQFHTCGLTAGGAAYCWGFNGMGQLGDATTNRRSAPVQVTGGLSFAAVSAGRYHTCGVTPADAAYCWGANEFGKLGDGTTTNRSTPTPVVQP